MKLTAVLFVRAIFALFSVITFLVVGDTFATIFAPELLQVTGEHVLAVFLVFLVPAVKVAVAFFLGGDAQAVTASDITLLTFSVT